MEEIRLSEVERMSHLVGFVSEQEQSFFNGEGCPTFVICKSRPE